MALVSSLAVGLGGALGAVSRYAVGIVIDSRALDTAVVNVSGSFLFGFVLAAGLSDPTTLALAVGFCGAFTTFSSFAVETIRLAEDGRAGSAVINAAGTLALALGAALLGGLFAGALRAV